VTVENARAANTSASLAGRLYSVHSAKIGGLVMKLLMTLSGLGLFVLGTFATYSFWVRRSNKKRRRTWDSATRFFGDYQSGEVLGSQ
jgi:uncharacterized iron-regulated membrane protein